MPLESEIKYDEGVYFGKPVSMVGGESRNGTGQIVAEFTITHIAHDGQWVEVQQANRRVYIYTSDAAWQNSKTRLESLGFNGYFNKPDFSDAVKAEGVSLVCKIEEYQGKNHEKWDVSGGGGEMKPMPADKARQLSARWKNEHPPKSTPAQPVNVASGVSQSATERTPQDDLMDPNDPNSKIPF
jgi:hypothetical protein